MGQKGTTTIDFGAHPGASNASVDVTGQAAILNTSAVDAWLIARTTVDHSIDEHVVDGPLVLAGDAVAGQGFTVYGNAPNGNLTGVWSVAWVWI